MFLLDGKPLALDRAFTHEGIQYPANWLRLASPAERAAIGVTEAPNPPVVDQRFYWGVSSTGTMIAKDHDDLVATWSEKTRNTANSLLTPTDWMVIRHADNGTEVPADVTAWRQDVRNACEAKITALTLTQTTQELETYLTTSTGATTDYSYWPVLGQTPPSPEPPTTNPPVDENIDFSGSSTSGTVILG